MRNYTPFLKSKINEFKALATLASDVSDDLIPFIDIKRNEKTYSASTYEKYLATLKKQIGKYLSRLPSFYLDDHDIGDDLSIRGVQSYEFSIKYLKNYNFIPVIGVEKNDERNSAVFSNKSIVKSDIVALRVSTIELRARKKDVIQLTNEAKKYFSYVHLIVDGRIVSSLDIDAHAATINSFLAKNKGLYSKIIIAGSSIPEQITEVAKPSKTSTVTRHEISLFSKLANNRNLFLGDYTIVTPKYLEKQLNRKIIFNIMTPKVIYSYDHFHIVFRGATLRKKGYFEYKKFCNELSSKNFFRGEAYSFGDSFIANADDYKKNITPGVILAPTINAHITYMYRDFQL